MSGRIIFDSPDHKVYMFDELTPASAVQANQYLIVHKGKGILLDPGGHKVFAKLLSDISNYIPPKHVRYIFLSHQDPDIVASLNGWLMTTEADAFISKLWMRFLPHFGLDTQLEGRLHPIDDRGTVFDLNGCTLYILPAHFLHSPGNFQIYDPVGKILFSGDLGASLGQDYFEVSDFEHHKKFMEFFHRRYIASSKICKLWARMVRNLDINIIAPQHGAIFRGKENVSKFIDWIDNLECGVDLMSEDNYKVPS